MSDLERIFDRVSTRLNNVLCEMKPGYDDSIVGFNEAWDVMRAVFKDELTKAASRTPDEPQAAPDRDAITRIINGIYGIGSGTYAGGHQDKSIARAVDAILETVKQ